MKRLTQREGRIVAVGILVGVIGLVWLAVIGPIVHGFVSRSHERAELRDTYVRDQRLLAAIPVWRRQAEQQRASAVRFSYGAPTDALASDLLKERIARVITAQGGTLKAAQEIPADNAGGWVAVRAELQLNMNQLYESLKRLENEDPYVSIDYVSVVADEAFKTGHLAPMDVRIEVSAQFRPSRTPQSGVDPAAGLGGAAGDPRPAAGAAVQNGASGG
jgi:general secretion pathway protein M